MIGWKGIAIFLDKHLCFNTIHIFLRLYWLFWTSFWLGNWKMEICVILAMFAQKKAKSSLKINCWFCFVWSLRTSLMCIVVEVAEGGPVLWLLALVTCDIWHLTHDTTHVTRDTRNIKHDMWHMKFLSSFSILFYPHTLRAAVSPYTGICNTL